MLCMSAGVSVSAAWGHGIGAERLPPQPLGDMMVSIQVEAGFVEDGAGQRLVFEVSDNDTNERIGGVLLGIRALKGGTLLWDDTFESRSGTLEVEMQQGRGETVVARPEGGIFGFVFGDTDVIRVTGPHFENGGLYQIFITVYEAGGIAADEALTWEAGISIPDITAWDIQDPNFGLQAIRHVSYYDVIRNFEYNPQGRLITFEMPFDARQASINQTAVVHEEVIFSKGFGDLMVSEMSLVVDGLVMDDDTVQIDDFAAGERIVHMTIYNDDIMALYDIGALADGRLGFVLGPSGTNLPYSTVTDNGQFRIMMNVSADPKAGEEVQVRYKIFDVFLRDRPISVEHLVRITAAGQTVMMQEGTSSDGDVWTDGVMFTMPEGEKIVLVNFENLGGAVVARAALPIVADRTQAAEPIAQWIRGVAGLWVEDAISDVEFTAAVEFLIKTEALTVGKTEGMAQQQESAEIPDWIRKIAGLWVEDAISDVEFTAAVEYLIALGIIRV